MQKNHEILKNTLALCFFVMINMLSSCYSVFSGGTGGLVVDAESTSSPKSGIANVDVYAYMSQGDRDDDFAAWQEGSVFAPQSDYYAHTITGSDGSFTISKLVWKETKPDFGRDADYATVYLLFYHENYGLTKGDSVIISDSVSDTVYTELTAVRKSTALNITFEDVASGSATANAVYVKVSVPQTTASKGSASPEVYDATVTGTGTITVSYPRYQSDEDKTSGTETAPEVSISYYQSADNIEWLGCYNADNDEQNYAFRTDESSSTTVTKIIKNPSYSVTLYGKSSVLDVPSVGGQYTADGTATGVVGDDGLKVRLLGKDSSGAYTLDFGEATTASQSVGTNGTEKHGTFSALGSGFSWTDTTYTEKYASIDLKLIVYGADGTEIASKEFSARSDVSSYNIQLP